MIGELPTPTAFHHSISVVVWGDAFIRSRVLILPILLVRHSFSDGRSKEESFVPIYTPYFVKFPNKNRPFRRFFGLVYPFTYIYTKNVRELPSTATAAMEF